MSLITFLYSYFYNRGVIRKRETINAYIDLQEYLYCIYEYPDNGIEDFVDDRNSDEYKKLSACIAHIEMFAVGVKHKVYDFRTVYELSHGFLDMSLREPIEYILEMKSKRNTQEDFYEGIHWLFSEMDKCSVKTK